MDKVIGICVTKVQGEECKSLLGSLFKSAQNADYRVCVFQSVYDFYGENEKGAAYVYDAIPYEKLCALVLVHNSIYDNGVVNRIIEEATSRNVPVIYVKGYDPRCYSLVGNYDKAYESLIRKIIVDRNIKDVFYISGRKGHSDSIKRLEIFRSVMKELEIPFDDSKVAYGDFIEKPARRIIDKLVAGGKTPPRAIFCANDLMAIAVMERLGKYGFSVPIDTVVAGFDGFEASIYGKPKISTCAENTDAVAMLTLKAISEATQEGVAPKVYNYEYEAVFSESAGYFGQDLETTRLGNEIYRRFRLDQADEENQNVWIDRVMGKQDLVGFRETLPEMLEHERAFIIRQDPYWEMEDGRARGKMPSTVLYMETDENGEVNEYIGDFGESVEQLIDKIPGNKVGFMSAISMNDLVYGIAFITTSDPFNGAGRMNRYAVTVNRAFSLAVNGEKQIFLAEQINRNRYTDQVTSMFNMDGASHWYADYIKRPDAHKSYFVCGIYMLVNYHELMSMYGVDFIEDALQFIANTLVLVNPDKEIIARVSSDTFAVINSYSVGQNNAEDIDHQTVDFYQILDVKKKKSDERWNKLEISCGYIVSGMGVFEDNLSTYFNSAISRLYRNRNLMLKDLPQDVNVADGSDILKYKVKLLTLLKENLFNYNFQPIVNAHTGEIIAYEGLMRTSGKIGMNPMEVLAAASMFEKSQDVEYATFLNILRRMQAEPESFEGKKVFVNTIPEYFLNDEQLDDFHRNFGEYLPQIVVEVTETKTIAQAELAKIRDLCGNGITTPVAIDDYGTGHSNIVNLLEYRPQLVKIDRYLINNIGEDKNKQIFVKNLLEFAQDNNIKVLAEGVETKEEMQTVIEFGVDYIQGYYTAKPTYEILQKLPENVYNEIVEINRNCKSE